MAKSRLYYVEGELEESLLKILKRQKKVAHGKICRFNVVQKQITIPRLMLLSPKTTVVLIFDTDTGSSDILRKNISMLKNEPRVDEVICIPQSKNFEDEIVRCCGLSNIKELLRSKSEKDFKHDFLNCDSLERALEMNGFDISKIWTTAPSGIFSEFKNESEKIKLKARR